MDVKRVFRIVVAIVTAVIVLAMTGLTIYAFTIPHIGMAISCFLIAILFGVMTVNDIKHFFFKPIETK